MIQFEYMVTDEYNPSTQYLNEFGKEGWELVGVDRGVHAGYSMDRTVMYWKRRLFGVVVEQDHDKGPTAPAFLKPEDFMPPHTFKDSTIRDDDRLIPVKDGLEMV